MSNWTLIIYCGLITYLTRFTMIALIKKEMFNDRIREILSFVPSAIFPAIIFPAIFINEFRTIPNRGKPKDISSNNCNGDWDIISKYNCDNFFWISILLVSNFCCIKTYEKNLHIYFLYISF